jgi:hypothetical protein
MVNTIRVAHGRMPYRGKRRVLAVLSEPWEKPPITHRSTLGARPAAALACT